MATVQIRNLDDEAYAVLKKRAAASGRSLQEYLRIELESLATGESMSEALARIRADLRWEGPPLTMEEILKARDEGRR